MDEILVGHELTGAKPGDQRPQPLVMGP